MWTTGTTHGQGPHARSTETCRCCTRTPPRCLESASWWASGSVTRLHPRPVSSCHPPWGRDAGSDPWPGSGIDQRRRQALAACPGDSGMAKWEAGAWVFLHTSSIFVPFGAPSSVVGRSRVSAGTGHGDHTVRPGSQPQLFLPLCGEAGKQPCVAGEAALATTFSGHLPHAQCLGQGLSWPRAWRQMGRLPHGGRTASVGVVFQ